MYRLIREQEISATRERIWDFIRTPHNLNSITPPELDFKIVSQVPERMFNGLIVEYVIRIPFFGRRKWVAEIKHIREFISFVDEQRIGPYKFWYHYHELIETDTGVRIIDRVYYEMPFGLLGRMLHFVIVRPTLEHIFAFRAERFKELLTG